MKDWGLITAKTLGLTFWAWMFYFLCDLLPEKRQVVVSGSFHYIVPADWWMLDSCGIIELAVAESLYLEAIPVYPSLFFGSFYVAIISYITEEMCETQWSRHESCYHIMLQLCHDVDWKICFKGTVLKLCYLFISSAVFQSFENFKLACSSTFCSNYSHNLLIQCTQNI